MNSSSIEAARRQRFDRLVAVFHADMYRYAAWLSRDKAIAEDVVQEALLRAWKSLESLRDDSAAKQWLLTIVRRENARYFERRRLETVDIDNLTASQAALIAEAPNEELNDLREAIYGLRRLSRAAGSAGPDGLQHQRDWRVDGTETRRRTDAPASGPIEVEGQSSGGGRSLRQHD